MRERLKELQKLVTAMKNLMNRFPNLRVDEFIQGEISTAESSLIHKSEMGIDSSLTMLRHLVEEYTKLYENKHIVKLEIEVAVFEEEWDNPEHIAKEIQATINQHCYGFGVKGLKVLQKK